MFFHSKKIKTLENQLNTVKKQLEVQEHSYSYHRSYGGVGDFLRNGSFSSRKSYQLYDASSALAVPVDKILRATEGLTPAIKGMDGKTVEANEDILTVLFNPGFNQSFAQFIKDVTLSYLLDNNYYLITDSNKITLRTVKPFNVVVTKSSNDGFVKDYKVTFNGKQITFNRKISGNSWRYFDHLGNELLHGKGQTDDIGLLGRNPVNAILLEILQHNSGNKHNNSILDNGMRASGIFTTDGVELSEEQGANLKEIVTNFFTGTANAGKVPIIDAPVKFTELSQNNRDMDFINILKNSANQVALKYNVPLPLVSPDHMSLSNYNAALEAFYDDAVFPVANEIFQSIGQILGLKEDQILSYDREIIPAIRERRTRELNNRSQTGLFSDNELRNELGHESYKTGDIIYKPSSSIPVGKINSSADLSDSSNTEQNDDKTPEVPDREKKWFIKNITKSYGKSKEQAEVLWQHLLK